ncbi:cytochrome P450 family protein [Ceratobasidium sp. AG-Ba]|nr:cytochrome P450 family protein [Ceratobasidium sp. AG-Ba]
MRMTYGHVVVENDPLLQMVRRQADYIMTGFAKHYWVNDLPILRYIPSWLPGAGFKRDAAYRRKQRAVIARVPFDAVLKDVGGGIIERSSYASKLLESKGGADASDEDIELVKWTAQPMFAAGSTTTVALIHSFLFMMSIYPEVATRVQAEIDAQVGRDRLPKLQDRDMMPYTDAVLQEVIRCNPVFVFGIEHCASEDFEVRGYTIKKGTTIEANIWALMHEPSTYPEPHTFNPDRFLKQTPDPDPRRFVFGFGRRVCPGQHIANNGAFTMCAAFMSVFNIAAGAETMREVERNGKDIWSMFTPSGPYEPKPFACTITPRDQTAQVILDMCKETEVIN